MNDVVEHAKDDYSPPDNDHNNWWAVDVWWQNNGLVLGSPDTFADMLGVDREEYRKVINDSQGTIDLWVRRSAAPTAGEAFKLAADYVGAQGKRVGSVGFVD